MYNLLLVDDELPILDSYYEILDDHFKNSLNIIKCSSSEEALKKTNNRIDILVTDIFMPIVDGYELQEKICTIWPKCRVIFLTGNTNISNVQKAIRFSSNILDYILKFDDDSVLINAMEKAISSLDNEIRVNDLMHDVQKNLQLALPVLRREFIYNLLTEPTPDKELIVEKIEQYQMDLDGNQPLLLLCSRLNSLDKNSPNNKTQIDTLHFAIDGIVNKYLLHHFNIFSLVYDKNKIVWLMQPKKSFPYKDNGELIYYVYSLLDIIQDNCTRVLKSALNFVMSRNLCQWTNINNLFIRLTAVLEQNKIIEDAILFLEDIASETLNFDESMPDDSDLILNNLNEALSEGDNSNLKENLNKIVRIMVKDRETFIILRFEISSIFIKYMKQIGLHKITYNDICSKLLDVKEYPLEYKRLYDEYINIINSFTHLLSKNTHSTKGVIDEVLKYIEDNIAGDLSLVTVSSTVFHSPTYLSKLFKKNMGVGFCKYVVNQRMKLACNMVLNSDKKINEIASIVGFDSVSYFIKTFKKTYNLSPQEYRNKYVS